MIKMKNQNLFIALLLSCVLFVGFRPPKANGSIAGMQKSSFQELYTDDGKATYTDCKDKSGVYVIKENNAVVYVGHSKTNLYKTMYRHFQTWNHSYQQVTTYRDKMKRNSYTARVILCTPAQSERLEGYLVNKYKPRDNDMKLHAYRDTDKGLPEYKQFQRADPVPF